MLALNTLKHVIEIYQISINIYCHRTFLFPFRIVTFLNAVDLILMSTVLKCLYVRNLDFTVKIVKKMY